ncbi:MAG: peptide ABC transporter substrate-binding protein [Puniceicoccales bacterium]|jgi:oligopeptide transport system substrate-binding protein|nr:peptide ABC transporter substrate-binding protein [Puniceicoccales bacterium]
MWKNFVLLMSIAGLLLGCKEVIPPPKQHLRIASVSEPASVDPQRVWDDSDYKILHALFEGLIVPDPETMEPLPGVAETWTISPDHRIYEFFLRDNAKWSDGSSVVADDFVYSASRALTSKFACSSVEMFFPLRNARAFFNRQIRNFSKVGISAVTHRTLRIELEQSDPNFLTVLMHPCWSPLNKNVVDSFARYNKGVTSGDIFRANVISNGPFGISERIMGTCMLLEKNPIYWDADNVILSSVLFLFGWDQTSNMKKLAEKEVDIVEIQRDGEFALGDRIAKSEFGISPAFEMVALTFNMSNSAFADRNIRMAMSLAIDRERILEEIEKNQALAAYNFFPCGDGDRPNGPLLKKDQQLAKKLFDDAGYGPSNKFPTIRMLCNASESDLYLPVASRIADDWKAVLGIDTQIEYKEFSSFLESRKKFHFDIVKSSYSGMYFDPALILLSLHSKNARNHGNWENAKYDAIIENIIGSENMPLREGLIKSAELLLAEEIPIVPLFFESNSYLARKRVRGWFPNIMNLHPLKFVYFAY